jgi:hypothetical protein
MLQHGASPRDPSRVHCHSGCHVAGNRRTRHAAVGRSNGDGRSGRHALLPVPQYAGPVQADHVVLKCMTLAGAVPGASLLAPAACQKISPVSTRRSIEMHPRFAIPLQWGPQPVRCRRRASARKNLRARSGALEARGDHVCSSRCLMKKPANRSAGPMMSGCCERCGACSLALSSTFRSILRNNPMFEPYLKIQQRMPSLAL